MDYRTEVRGNVTYAYIDIPFWNAEKACKDQKRKYLGQVVDGIFVPNKKLKKDNLKAETPILSSAEAKLLCDPKKHFYGAVYLLEKISNSLDLSRDLDACFGEDAFDILSLAFYLVLQEGQPVTRFQKWELIHRPSTGKSLTPERLEALLNNITSEKIAKYFERHQGLLVEESYLVCKNRFISSYGEMERCLSLGAKKDKEDIPEMYLAVLYGAESLVPLGYKVLPLENPELTSFTNPFPERSYLRHSKLNYVLDKTCASDKELMDILKENSHFLIQASSTLALVRKHLPSSHAEFIKSTAGKQVFGYYLKSYSEKIPVSDEATSSENTTLYIHACYKEESFQEERARFIRKLERYKEELLLGLKKPEHADFYQKYFMVDESLPRELSVTYNLAAIKETEDYLGYRILVTDSVADSITALRSYQLQDLIQKSYSNLLEKMNPTLSPLTSYKNLEAKFFLEFIALELLSYLKIDVEENPVFLQFSIESLLDELDFIDYYEEADRKDKSNEMTPKDHGLLKAIGFELLTLA